MARVDGPLFSLAASGSLAETVVYSRWKGRPYVRQLVIPSNPKSGPQTGRRAMFGYLSQVWAGLTDPQKATWEAAADVINASPFNAFMQQNMARWNRFESPTKSDPATETGTPGTLGSFTPAGGVREITVDINLTTVADNWGAAIAISQTSAFTPSISDVRKIVTKETTGSTTYIVSPVTPGSWFVTIALFTDDGVFDSWQADAGVTVT